MPERIGSYRILSFIGAGRMGEVYRAKDLKLDREVRSRSCPTTSPTIPGARWHLPGDRQCPKRALEVAPNNFMAQCFLALNHGVKGMGSEVDGECATMMKMLGGADAMQVIGTCVWAYAAVAHTELAPALLHTLERPPVGIWQDPVVVSNA